MRTNLSGFKHCARTLTLAALLVCVGLPAQAAHAQVRNPFYVGLDAHAWRLEPDRGSTWSAVGVRGKLGAQIAEQVSVEAHLATGGSDRANNVSLSLDHVFGFFIRGDIPITRYLGLYGLLGYSEVKADVRGFSGKESSVSFGVGADYAVSNTTSLNIDWIRYVDHSNFDYSALGVGARWRF